MVIITNTQEIINNYDMVLIYFSCENCEEYKILSYLGKEDIRNKNILRNEKGSATLTLNINNVDKKRV